MAMHFLVSFCLVNAYLPPPVMAIVQVAMLLALAVVGMLAIVVVAFVH
jgi:hypothetical protein